MSERGIIGTIIYTELVEAMEKDGYRVVSNCNIEKFVWKITDQFIAVSKNKPNTLNSP